MFEDCQISFQPETEALVLNRVLESFERQAECGRWDNGRYLCRYFIWGKGPTLLFIHGLADDATSFVLPISILKNHFRCITYNLPVGGKDRARLGSYRHDTLVGDALGLLDYLKIGQSYLFGSSFGSTIALGAMEEDPDRFPRAILQGAFAYRPLAISEVMLAQLARYWPGKMRCLPFRQKLLHHLHYHAFRGREPGIWDYFLKRANNPPISAVAWRALLLHYLDLRPRLGGISQPILLVSGDRDPLVERACEQILMDFLPNVSMAEIEQCGHLPYFTHPEILAELILRFLTPLPCH